MEPLRGKGATPLDPSKGTPQGVEPGHGRADLLTRRSITASGRDGRRTGGSQSVRARRTRRESERRPQEDGVETSYQGAFSCASTTRGATEPQKVALWGKILPHFLTVARGTSAPTLRVGRETDASAAWAGEMPALPIPGPRRPRPRFSAEIFIPGGRAVDSRPRSSHLSAEPSILAKSRGTSVPRASISLWHRGSPTEGAILDGTRHCSSLRNAPIRPSRT